MGDTDTDTGTKIDTDEFCDFPDTIFPVFPGRPLGWMDSINHLFGGDKVQYSAMECSVVQHIALHCIALL